MPRITISSLTQTCPPTKRKDDLTDDPPYGDFISLQQSKATAAGKKTNATRLEASKKKKHVAQNVFII